MAEYAIAAQIRTRQPVDMIVAGIVLLINIVNNAGTRFKHVLASTSM